MSPLISTKHVSAWENILSNAALLIVLSVTCVHSVATWLQQFVSSNNPLP